MLVNGLSKLFAVKDGGHLSGEDTARINAVLINVAPSGIPEEQVENVMDYINAELLHNQVSADVQSALERLYDQLQAR
jgi:hypothetical protein